MSISVVEEQEGGCQIAGEGGETDALRLGRHVAYLADGLEAVVVGGAPPFALIVENAALVSRTDIAADRAHDAVGGAGDRMRPPRRWPG